MVLEEMAEAWGPLVDELFGVGEAGVAAGGEVRDELLRGEAGGGEGFGAEGPDGGDPGKAGEFAPEVGEVEPEEWGFGGVVDGGAMLAGEEGGVADEEGGVGGGEHGAVVGWAGRERWGGCGGSARRGCGCRRRSCGWRCRRRRCGLAGELRRGRASWDF